MYYSNSHKPFTYNVNMHLDGFFCFIYGWLNRSLRTTKKKKITRKPYKSYIYNNVSHSHYILYYDYLIIINYMKTCMGVGWEF